MRMKLLLIILILYSTSATASCNRVYRFLLGTAAPILSGSYELLKGDGCSNGERLSLNDLFNPDIFLRHDYSSIVQETFNSLENDDSWNPEALLVQNMKKLAPTQYEEMKLYLIDNTSSLARLNSSEKALVKENPAAALWVMYNGKKAQNLETRYSKSLQAEITGPQRENSGYLGTGDAFRHIAWNVMSSKFGFEEFAAKFIDAHEKKDEVEENAGGFGGIGGFGGFDTNSNSQQDESQMSISQLLMNEQFKKGDKHSEHNQALDSKMDAHNNNLGREIAEDLYCTTDEDDIFDSILNAINSGQAVIVDSCEGEKHVMIQSNETFRECESTRNLFNYQEACNEIAQNINVDTSISELKKLVREGAMPGAVSCAYYSHIETALKEKFSKDETINDIFSRRDQIRKEQTSTEQDSMMMPSSISVEEDDFDYVCKKISESFGQKFKEPGQCEDALQKMGIIEVWDDFETGNMTGANPIQGEFMPQEAQGI